MEMSPEPITRPEIDAKLQALETRMDAKIDRIEAKVDALVLTVNEFMRETKTDMRDLRKEMRSWGIGVIVTVITTAIGGMLGVWQIVASVSQANIAAYESGRSVEKSTADAVRSIERLLENVERQQKR